MGDGKKLKEVVASKESNIRKLSKATGIKQSTLYSIVQKDSNIRYDYALRIATALDINPSEICSHVPDDETIQDCGKTIGLDSDEMSDVLFKSRLRNYLLDSICPMIGMYGEEELSNLDDLLRAFYQLDDKARQAFIKMLSVMVGFYEDPQRTKDISKIKGW